VIALVRNKPATEKALEAEIARDNVFVVEGDITNYDSLKVREDSALKFIFFLLFASFFRLIRFVVPLA
jgi:hypothetical protein